MKQNLPFITYLSSNFWVLLGVFVFFLVVLDLILVRWLKLGKAAWKRVDYIWLAVAALGLLSTSSEARRLLATNLLENQKVFTAASYSHFRYLAEFGTGPVICRQFTQTQYSPENLDEMQREYDLACEYYKSLVAALPTTVPEKFDRVEMPSNLKRLSFTDKILVEDFRRLDRAFGDYAQAQKELEELVASQSRSNLEMSAAILGPLLLAFALALRITKVTGEIKLEK
jgi:hypothetical protein